MGLALTSSAAFAEPYIGAAGGIGFTNATDKIEQQTGYDYVSSKDDGKAAVSIYAGYAFNRQLAVEAGYTDFGKYSIKGSYGGFLAEDSIRAQVVSASVVGSLPLSSVFGLEGRVGLGVMNQKYHCVRLCSNSMSDADDTSAVALIGVGAHWDLTRNLTLRTRFDYYAGANSPLGGDNSDIDYSLVSVGADWHF
ncbi:outer membrane beta-barrel protein [Uliginosibacterium gangwonense]|uniref:outer membrane beta-barrel protein n=1 Tax=Uliginosibacterium gangwonense TaxID=392736 RepID=UPI0003813448|nr:outer membrane beta-barrel protein [Uliginosibacterium gangwonense]